MHLSYRRDLNDGDEDISIYKPNTPTETIPGYPTQVIFEDFINSVPSLEENIC